VTEAGLCSIEQAHAWLSRMSASTWHRTLQTLSRPLRTGIVSVYRDLLTVALEVRGRIVIYPTVSLQTDTLPCSLALCSVGLRARPRRWVAIALLESHACWTCRP
jgi:hypothetical protein